MRERLSDGVLNGHAHIGPIKTLERLASVLEHKARALRGAIVVFAEYAREAKRATARATIDRALELDADAGGNADRGRPPKRRPGKSSRPDYHTRSNILARRRATAKFLATFDPAKPHKPSSPGQGAGYLARWCDTGFSSNADPRDS